MALPEPLNKSLKATASVVVAELYTEGKAAANDNAEWPYAQISELLDERTCPLCAAVDGKVLKVGTPEYAKWRGPSHINCRRVLAYIHKDEQGEQDWFEEPAAELVKKHGHFHVDPERHAELRIPAEPAGRHVVVRRVKDPKTGKVEARLDWAPWWDQVPEKTKTLVLKARVASDAELPALLEKLGITDRKDPAQLRQATLLGLRDRLEGWITEEPAPGSEPPSETPTPARVKVKRKPGSAFKPAGTPVSAALELQAPGMKTRMRRVLRVIDAVHGDGELPVIPAVLAPADARYLGSYDPDPEWRRVEVLRTGAVPELTFAHEIGHFLDHLGISPGPRFSSVSDATMQPWRDAVSASEAAKELRKLFTERTVELATPEGGTAAYPVAPSHVLYLLRTKELWARSYAQYIALRSGDEVLLEQLNRLRGGLVPGAYPHRQWADEDFEPIAAAMDELFEALGWRVKRK